MNDNGRMDGRMDESTDSRMCDQPAVLVGNPTIQGVTDSGATSDTCPTGRYPRQTERLESLIGLDLYRGLAGESEIWLGTIVATFSGRRPIILRTPGGDELPWHDIRQVNDLMGRKYLVRPSHQH